MNNPHTITTMVVGLAYVRIVRRAENDQPAARGANVEAGFVREFQNAVRAEVIEDNNNDVTASAVASTNGQTVIVQHRPGLTPTQVTARMGIM